MSNNSPAPQTVFVVDDDEAVRDSLHWLLEARNLEVRSFASGAAFLAAVSPQWRGCVVLDVRMPGIGGFEVFDSMRAMGITLPTVFLTGHGDVPMAVDLLKNGAFDFFEKPFNDNKLMDRVEQALAASRQAGARAEVRERLAALSQREREVLDLILDGKMNKVIADQLGISMRTVEVHRAHIFSKMNVKTAVELARLLQ